MIKKYAKLFLYFIFCLFLASCTFDSILVGDISFTIPRTAETSATESNKETIYKVILTRDDKIILEKNFNTNNIHIDDLQIGTYKISIGWEDNDYTYYGEAPAEVKGGVTTDVTILVTITPKSKTPPANTTLQKITAKLTKSGVLFNETVTINDFTITEHYSDGKEYPGKNGDYKLTQPVPTNKLQIVKASIQNISNPKITAEADVKINYDLPNLEVTTTSPTETAISVPQFTEEKTISININPENYKNLPYPNDKNTTTIDWLVSDSENGDYKLAPGSQNEPTFIIPNSLANTKYYKAQVTVKPSTERSDFCASSQKQNITAPIAISVKPWHLAITDKTAGSDGNITLEGGKTYTLELANDASSTNPSVTWELPSGFSVSGTTLTVPDTELTGTISAVINKGSADEKVLASISVKVPAKLTATKVSNFTELQTAINEKKSEIIITNDIQFTSTITISNKTKIISDKNVTLTRGNDTFKKEFFVIASNIVDLGDTTNQITIDGKFSQPDIYAEAPIFTINTGTPVGTLNLYNTILINNENHASNGGAIANNGGNCTLFKVTIYKNNTTQNGGGIYNNNGKLDLNTVTIGSDITGNGNMADQNGGGIAITGTSTVKLWNSENIFNNNTAQNIGGGIWVENGTITVEKCTLSGNTAIGSTIDATGKYNMYVSASATYNGSKGEKTFADDTVTLP